MRGFRKCSYSEPVEGMSAVPLDLSQLGGTRHLSAAQFVHDQRDAFAMVASQDGRFSIFTPGDRVKSGCMAHRVEALLL
jgi:DNA integrity scanning protein DisA with diadenylate cyclase activity